ncbi:HAD family hydrolase [Acinetobacter nectaris]|uniref:HAD family hydrolase n=1 Tax=Acinetobacter nectaris TaxID=1219382 RepID=UPI001F2959F9|nr:HAD family hydrolase [Acinetobacter nectaris]MCF9046138.1 HAD family hydrolase [Acinetobacter nectaris]
MSLSLDTKPSVIVFDVFGTLVKIGKKNHPYKTLLKYLKQQGRAPQSNDARYIMSVDADFTQLALKWGMQIPEDILEALVFDLNEELKTIELFSDSLSTLEQLRCEGYRLALCSNLATPYGKVVGTMLPELDAYAWSYEVSTTKPDPSIYQYLIDELDCHASEVLFIGDTPSADMHGPIEFGMSARLINRKKGQTFADILGDILPKVEV